MPTMHVYLIPTSTSLFQQGKSLRAEGIVALAGSSQTLTQATCWEIGEVAKVKLQAATRSLQIITLQVSQARVKEWNGVPYLSLNDAEILTQEPLESDQDASASTLLKDLPEFEKWVSALRANRHIPEHLTLNRFQSIFTSLESLGFPPMTLEKLRSGTSSSLEALSAHQGVSLEQVCFEGVAELYRKAHFAAARRHHHSEAGGLVRHVRDMLRLLAGIENYPVVDRRIVATAIVWHDLFKPEEYVCRVDGTYDAYGQHAYGHLLQATLVLHSLPWECPRDKEAVVHAVASHHGKLEWGSPVVPQTPEATLLHLIDYMDSQMDKALDQRAEGSS